MRGRIVAGALGNCVHVAGTVGFLRAAEQLGYETRFLGAAVSVDRFVEAIREFDPNIVGISYRLTPDVARNLVTDLRARLEESELAQRRFVFGGTPPVCEAVEELGWFDRCFTGLENPDEVYAYLRGEQVRSTPQDFGSTLSERLAKKLPNPLLRHHLGLPTVQGTVDAARRVAEAGVLDVISVAPDQNAQECFFRPEEMDSALDGAGGVPIRCRGHLESIYEATRCGNYPLLRVYSGTRDLISWAEMSAQTVQNAWAAIPLCWYSVLDGRSERPLEDAIRENQAAMRWHAERGIPVEVNESHHWSLREAHDTVAVVAAFLAAYNAKRMGVTDYVAQYMFNSPPTTSGAMDLAKMLAKIELIESLHDSRFSSVRQVRAGLLSLSPRMDVAKGQLAASTVLALAVRPHIIHVVGYCEGDHAADAEDIIESCRIVQGVLRNCLFGMPEMPVDPVVRQRKQELLDEAQVLLDAIRQLGSGDEDPLASPRVLALAVRVGLLDAPHLKGNPHAAGLLETRTVNGAVRAVDPGSGEVLSECERVARIMSGAAGAVKAT